MNYYKNLYGAILFVGVLLSASVAVAADPITLLIDHNQKIAITEPKGYLYLTKEQVPSLYETYERLNKSGGDLKALVVKSGTDNLYDGWVFISEFGENKLENNLSNQDFEQVKKLLKEQAADKSRSNDMRRNVNATASEKYNRKLLDIRAGQVLIDDNQSLSMLFLLKTGGKQEDNIKRIVNIDNYLLLKGQIVSLSSYRYCSTKEEAMEFQEDNQKWLEYLIKTNK